MFADAALIFMRAVAQCFSWFSDMLVKGGAFGSFVAAFFIVQVGRFLLSPIFGSAGSDKARKSKGDDDE